MKGPQRAVAELALAKLDRAIYSERQLYEVMVDFWFNHFNVFAGKGADRWMLTSYERDAIRPHVDGGTGLDPVIAQVVFLVAVAAKCKLALAVVAVVKRKNSLCHVVLRCDTPTKWYHPSVPHVLHPAFPAATATGRVLQRRM